MIANYAKSEGSFFSFGMAQNKSKLLNVENHVVCQSEALAQSREQLSAIQKELNVAVFRAVMLQTQISDLIDLAHIQSRNTRINCEYFNITELIDRAFDIISSFCLDSQIELTSDIDS